MMGLSSSEIKNAAMNELPLFSVIAPATKHKLIQMIMTRNTTATMAEVNHTALWVVKPRRYSMYGFDRLQSPTPFLCSDHSLRAHQHRMRPRRSGGVVPLVVDDRCDMRFEVLERFDWPLHRWF